MRYPHTTSDDPTTTERLERIAKTIRAKASESPDFRYSSLADGVCHYSPDEDNPEGCIIGAAMRDEGYSLDGSRYEGNSAWQAVIKRLRLDKGYQSIDWMTTVQERQDSGDTWAEAVEWADEHCEFKPGLEGS